MVSKLAKLSTMDKIPNLQKNHSLLILTSSLGLLMLLGLKSQKTSNCRDSHYFNSAILAYTGCLQQSGWK